MGKRILILLGAGAAYHWFDEEKGITAKSSDILNEIIENKSFCKELNTRLEKEKQPINFETIINEVEILFLYYYALFHPKDVNFIRDHEKEKWISNFFKTDDVSLIKDKLYAIFQDCIQIIISRIRRYDSCIKSNWKQKTDDLKTFLLFINGVEYKNILRSYTLNYDQMLIDASNKTQLNFFDGFEKPIDPINNTLLTADLKHYSTEKILKYSETNCFYNLHGSIYLHWLEAVKQYVKMDHIFEKYEFDDIISNLTKSKKGIRILKAPIITGFQKIERLDFEPFNTMFKAFQNDCSFADIFIIIGYSFCDPHINDILKSAEIAKKKIVIVDYNQMDSPVSHNLQEIIGEYNAREIIFGKNKEGNIFYFKKGISNFLSQQQYKTVNFFKLP